MKLFSGRDPRTGCAIHAVEVESGQDVGIAEAERAVRSLRTVAGGGAALVIIAGCFDVGVSAHIDSVHPGVQLWIRDAETAHHLPASKAASEFLRQHAAATRR